MFHREQNEFTEDFFYQKKWLEIFCAKNYEKVTISQYIYDSEKSLKKM